MNTQKLNELAASAMGWVKKSEPSAWLPQLGDDEYWEGQAGEGRVAVQNWNPCGDLNDASALLEKVCDGRSWNVNRNHKNYSGLKYIVITNKEPYKISCGEADTEALAKTLCALRASGIPESSITEAMQ